MAIYEKNGVFNYLDASGNQNILYPVTKSDNVDGLDDELALKVNVADVVNNLTSSDTNKPLSAKQGKVLQDGKQAKLVSGTNIKTINGVSILGSGDMTTPIPTASASTLGGVKIGSGINVTTEGVISAQEYSLPTASASVKGGVKIGTNLSMNGEVLNNTYVYNLPTASSSTLGGVKVGSNLSISNGVLNASDGKFYGIDISNLIATAYSEGSWTGSGSYTATEDCYFAMYLQYGSTIFKDVKIDGVSIGLSLGNSSGGAIVPLKSGQVISYTWGNIARYYVFGLKQ